MAIKLITGVLGGGKGRYMIRLLLKELRETERPIITNFAVEQLPWINGIGKLQLGLAAYCKFELKNKELTEAAENRVFRITDDITSEFFLYRTVKHGDESGIEKSEIYQKGIKFDIYKAAAIYKISKDNEKKVLSFDLELINKGGICYMIDEAWKFWGAREWDSTSKAFVFYAAHSRKTADDLWLCTQNSKDIDSAIIRKCQDFHHCVNFGKRMIGIFRQPAKIRVHIHASPPTGAPNEKPMRVVSIDTKGDKIDQCYDTTGGIGISGRMVGDLKEKPPGLPFWILATLIITTPIVIFYCIHLVINHYTEAGKKKIKPLNSEVQNTNTVSQDVANYFTKVGKDATANMAQTTTTRMEQTNTEEVYCTGYAIVDGVPYAALSNGETYTGNEVKGITSRALFLTNGEKYNRKAYRNPEHITENGNPFLHNANPFTQ